MRIHVCVCSFYKCPSKSLCRVNLSFHQMCVFKRNSVVRVAAIETKNKLKLYLSIDHTRKMSQEANHNRLKIQIEAFLIFVQEKIL